jgi:uncharacterized repeat protein (TIGR01451 family)
MLVVVLGAFALTVWLAADPEAGRPAVELLGASHQRPVGFGAAVGNPLMLSAGPLRRCHGLMARDTTREGDEMTAFGSGARTRGLHPPRFLIVIACLAFAATIGAVRASPAAASHTLDVSARITFVDVLDDALEGTGRGTADLYAGFAIGTSTFRDCGTFASHQHDTPEIRPTDWVCSAQISVQNDTLPGFTNVDLQIWDHDDCDNPFCNNTGELESNDDQADASPGSNSTLSLSVSLTDGKWTSAGGTTGADWPRNCAQGEGESAVKVCWEISIDSANGDADGDALLDGWERLGYNADGDASIDVDLPAMGVDPLKKDLLLELDCLVGAGADNHCPLQAAVTDVVRGFANAPEINADGSWGIQLHIDVGNIYGNGLNVATTVARTESPTTNGAAGTVGNYGSSTSIPEAGNEILDFDGNIGDDAVDIGVFRSMNMDAKRFAIMRYGVFGHQTNARAAANDCTSGLANGDVFMVTLGGNGAPPAGAATGGPCWEVAAGTSISIGSQAQQAGTLMHEYGHTIGFPHGGADGYNGKPNYFSVMSYAFQECAVPPRAAIGLPGGCDFSRVALPTLDENALDECAGLGMGLGPNNWNGDGTLGGGPFLDGTTCDPSSPNIAFNINGDTSNDANKNEVQDGSEPPLLVELKGFDDWANVQYKLKAAGGGAGAGGLNGGDLEATPELIAHAEALMAELVRPAPAVDKTGPADAEPGDTLDYSLSATNTANATDVASGPSFLTKLVDTKPDGTTAEFPIGTIQVGGAATRSLTYDVPCDTADGAVLTNAVALTAEDLLGNAFTASDTVGTTIHAPVVTITKTATAGVNAGEAITYTISYENIGGAAAANVAITDTLPAGVYYSLGLDAGSGPKPSAVVTNADGTTTLSWSIGNVSSGSGSASIVFTARPTLLLLGGETLTNSAVLTFENGNGCEYQSESASASTTISVAPATRDPLSMGFWRNHPELWSDEFRARIQATDQRFDGADGSAPDGVLSAAEVSAILAPSGNGVRVLQQQLTGTYLNLASRRINAATVIDSKLTRRLGLANVRDAVVYAQETLNLPLTKATQTRYSDATSILDQVNLNKVEVY